MVKRRFALSGSLQFEIGKKLEVRRNARFEYAMEIMKVKIIKEISKNKIIV